MLSSASLTIYVCLVDCFFVVVAFEQQLGSRAIFCDAKGISLGT